MQILCGLKFKYILALRLTNTLFYHLIQQNVSPIVRHFIRTDASPLLLELWPPPQIPQPASFSYFLGLTHRKVIVRDLAKHIATFIMRKICRRTTESQKEGFQLQYQRIRARCEPLILTLYHFFESYRHISWVPYVNKVLASEQTGPLYIWCFPSGSPQEVEKQIIDRYDPEQLLQVHQMYKLLLAAFVRKLRPPSYAGRVERALRGWHKDPASQDDIVKVLLLGGIPEVKRIIEIEPYSARRIALDDFIKGALPSDEKLTRSNGVVSEPPVALSSDPALVANSVDRFITAFLNEEVSGHITGSFPELNEIWSRAAVDVLLDKNVISSVHEVPVMREFVESLMKEEEDATGLQDDVLDGTSDREADSIRS